MTPTTVSGRIVGAICAVTGTLVIALPVPIVSENFSLFYKQERRRRMVQERRAALEKAHMEGKVMDYEGQREEKAAAYIQERFRGRGPVRRSNTNLRVDNEFEEFNHPHRKESYPRRVRPRTLSQDNSIQSDQPPYYKKKIRVDDEGHFNGGYVRSGSISVDNSPKVERRKHHHHHHGHHGGHRGSN